MWWALVWGLAIFLFLGGGGMVVRLVEGRRQHAHAMAQERARLAEAEVRARELGVREQELAQKRAELSYREALLELERFDRGTGVAPGRSPGPVREDPVLDDPVRNDPMRDDPMRDDSVRDDPADGTGSGDRPRD